MPETTTPDTMSYLILGLVATASITLLYIGSLAVRYRNLQKDEQTLEALQNDQ